MTIKLKITWPIEKLIIVNACEKSELLLLKHSNESDFIELQGSTIIINKMFGYINILKDVDRYKVSKFNSKIRLKNHKRNNKQNKNCNYNDINPQYKIPNIVLILESPHKDEYENIEGFLKPISPANSNKHGGTGESIEKYLAENIFNHSLIFDKVINNSRLIIANPIQFQTSLSAAFSNKIFDKKLRNSIWNALWDQEEIKRNFIERLILYNPYLVINACTGGQKNKSSLNNTISDFLVENGFENISYKTVHPSSLWFRIKREKLVSKLVTEIPLSQNDEF